MNNLGYSGSFFGTSLYILSCHVICTGLYKLLTLNTHIRSYTQKQPALIPLVRHCASQACKSAQLMSIVSCCSQSMLETGQIQGSYSNL